MKSFQFTNSDLLISPEDLVRELAKRIDEFTAGNLDAKSPLWTFKVKEFIYKIGKSLERPGDNLEIEVLYSDANRGLHEYLLDVVWWCRYGAKKDDEFMALAAEVEWSTWGPSKGTKRDAWVKDRVGEDFGKLTVVKCPLKLMVFCTDECGEGKSHESMQKVVLREADRYLNCYRHHVPGEYYVFLDIASKMQRRAWVRSVGSDGVLLSRSEIRVE